MARNYAGLTRIAKVAAATASSTGTVTKISGVDLANYISGVALLSVTAVTGTLPTSTINLEGSTDGSVWSTLASFTTQTAAGGWYLSVDRFLPQMRANVAALGGTVTPSFTYELFAIGMEEHYYPSTGVVTTA